MSRVDPAELLARSTVIAVVGASSDPAKAAHRIPALLVELGYEVVPVNPHTDELFGVPVVRSLAEIDRPIDIVDVFRPAADAPDVARQAAEVGARAVWLQLDITSTGAAEIADGAGMDYVEDTCIGVVATALQADPPRGDH